MSPIQLLPRPSHELWHVHAHYDLSAELPQAPRLEYSRSCIYYNIMYNCNVQPDQLNMAVFFLYLIKNYLISVRYRTKHPFKATRKTQPCITGHPVRQNRVLTIDKTA